MVDVEVKQSTTEFKIQNNKSGFVGTVKLIEKYKKKKKEFSECLFLVGNEVVLKLSKYSEPNIGHFKYVADINSFHLTVGQIKYGIEEMLEEEKKKKAKK